MSDAHSDYNHGEMSITGQGKTFTGFISGSIWGAGLIIISCLYAILTFAVGLAWIPSLIAATLIGFIYGFVLKLKANWHMSVIGLAIFGGIISLLVVVLK
ncbi:MAG: aa3-type cytochrome c oxidase subunit IV [Robiginitomaculum sp.]